MKTSTNKIKTIYFLFFLFCQIDEGSMVLKKVEKDNFIQPVTSGENFEQSTGIPVHSILALNNDCIEKILGFLPVSDLPAISRTCIRLQTIACSVFTKFHTVLDVEKCGVEPVQLHYIFMNFSHLIKEIRFRISHMQPFFFSPGIHNLMKLHRFEVLESVFMDDMQIKEEDNKKTKERVCKFSVLKNP